MAGAEQPPTRRVLPRTGYPRRRAVTACQVCRERKKRCDNSRPVCSFCKKIGVQCQYAERDEASFDSASLAILDRLSALESLVRSQQGSAAPAASPASAPSLQSPSSVTQLPPENVFTPGTGASSKVRTDVVLQWPIFEKPLSSLKRFPYLNSRGEQDYTYLEDGLHQSQAGSQDPVSPSMHTRSSNGAPMSISTERVDIERLVDQFFSRVHVKNPILDRQTVKQYCQEYYEHGPLFNLRVCLVLLICALGSVAPDFQPSGPLNEDLEEWPRQPERADNLKTGRCYYAAAEKRLSAAMVKPHSVGVQCLCLAGIYHMYTLNPVAAQAMFHSAGFTLQMLISTGADSLEGESQVGSSLFWACSKSEGELFAEVPITVSALCGQGQSNGYPLPPQERFMVPGTDDIWAQADEDSWYFFLSEIALRRISDKIAEIVGAFSDETRHPPSNEERSQRTVVEELIPVTLELERQVHAWREHLPPRMQFPDVPRPAQTEWQQHLRAPYYRVLELLHRPFVFAAIHHQNPSPMVSMLASKGLDGACTYLLHGHPTHRHHGRFLQLRYELKISCILFAASGSNVEMPPGWYEAVQGALRSLRYWQWEAPLYKTYIEVLEAVDRYFMRDKDPQYTDENHSID